MVAMLGSDGVCQSRGVFGRQAGAGFGYQDSVSKFMEPAAMRRVMGAGAWTSEDGRPWSNPTQASLGVEIRQNGGIFIAFRSSRVDLLGPTKPRRRRRRRRQPPSGDSLGWWHSDHPLMAALQMLGLDGALANGVARLAIRRSKDGPKQPLSANPKWQGGGWPVPLAGAGNEPRQNDACGGGVPGRP